MKRLSFKQLILALLLAPIILIVITAIFIGSHYDNQATISADCAVVFGAAVWRDDIPSHALYDRTMSAAQLYKEGLVGCIVLSGGSSTYGAHEVAVMQDILIAEAVPQDIFILDPHGVKTIVTLNNLDKSKSYILVSNDFHLARISFLAKRADLENFILHAATYHNGRYAKEPYFFLREIGGTLYYFFGIHRFQSLFY